MFCGGSLIAKSGFRLGRTSDANWVGDRLCEMVNTFGRIYGKRCVSFILNTSQTVNKRVFG